MTAHNATSELNRRQPALDRINRVFRFMSQSIPQTDPRANYHSHREEIDAAIARVLEGGWYILGEEVRAFEREFADVI